MIDPDRALALDRALDSLVAGSTPTGSASPELAAARWLHRHAHRPVPAPTFAAALRAALVDGSTAMAAPAPTGAPAAQLTAVAGPASLPTRPLRRRTFLEVAAVLALLVATVTILALAANRDPSSPSTGGPGSRQVQGSAEASAMQPTPVVGIQPAFVEVAATEPLRADPSRSAVALRSLQPGEQLVWTDPAVERDGERWAPVTVAPSGEAGWVPVAMLVRASVSMLWLPGTTVMTTEPAPISVWIDLGLVVQDVAPKGAPLVVLGAADAVDGALSLPVLDASTGTRGWVSAELVSPDGKPNPPDLPSAWWGLVYAGAQVDVAVGPLQLRVGPSWDAPPLAELLAGDRLTVVRRTEDERGLDFAYVETAAGQRGWVALRFVRTIDGELATRQAAIAAGATPDRSGTLTGADQAWLTVRPPATLPYNPVGLRWLSATDATELRVEPGPYGAVASTLAPGDRAEFTGEWLATRDAISVAVRLPGSDPQSPPLWANVAALQPAANDERAVQATRTAGAPTVPPLVIEVPAASPFAPGDVLYTTYEITLRRRPASDSAAVAHVRAGERLLVVAAPVRDDAGVTWVQVELAGSGITGWAPRPWLTDIAPPGTDRIGMRVVTTERVNLRSQPGASADIVAILEPGDELVVLSAPSEAEGYIWIRVRFVTTGQEGYVADEFTELAPASTPTPGD